MENINLDAVFILNMGLPFVDTIKKACAISAICSIGTQKNSQFERMQSTDLKWWIEWFYVAEFLFHFFFGAGMLHNLRARWWKRVFLSFIQNKDRVKMCMHLRKCVLRFKALVFEVISTAWKFNYINRFRVLLNNIVHLHEIRFKEMQWKKMQQQQTHFYPIIQHKRQPLASPFKIKFKKYHEFLNWIFSKAWSVHTNSSLRSFSFSHSSEWCEMAKFI